MPRAYPRLGDASGLELLANLKAAAEGSRRLDDLVAFEHPASEPVATGASVATVGWIRDVRANVEAGLADLWTPGGQVRAGVRSELDRRLGKLLHKQLDIVPADAAHAGTWTFLTLVVFPDLAVARFPDLHEKRFLGGPRNVLRRTWVREEVLGDLHSGRASPLGEDELVGLFERTALARNRRLVRALAEHVLSSNIAPRSEYARELYKRATYATGPLLLDALDDAQLAGLVAAAGKGEEWPTVRDLEASRTDPPAPKVIGTDKPSAGAAGGDVVLRFHRDAVEMGRRILRETTYRPRQLFAMLNEQGGVECARRVVGQTKPSSGFIALFEFGRLDLTFEALVVRQEYRGLFPAEVVETAVSRLDDFGSSSAGES